MARTATMAVPMHGTHIALPHARRTAESDIVHGMWVGNMLSGQPMMSRYSSGRKRLLSCKETRSVDVHNLIIANGATPEQSLSFQIYTHRTMLAASDM